MKSILCTAIRFVLPPALFLALSFSLYPLDGETEIIPIPPNSGNALNRLIEISDQLSALNTRLQSELQDSRRNSRELQNELETTRQELYVLKQELETLRIASRELSRKAENSQAESTELAEALKKAESSLLNLELSFGTYRQTAERRITSLKRENILWKIGCAAAGILAAGLGTAFIAAQF